MKKYNRESQSQPVGRQNSFAKKVDRQNSTKKITNPKNPKKEKTTRRSHPSSVFAKAMSESSSEIGEHRTMTRNAPLSSAPAPLASSHDIITELARVGAKQILAAALEQEVSEYIEQYVKNRDEHGHQPIVRNGHCEPRHLRTGIGNIEIEQPRVRDKREKSEREKFTSQILPPY